MRRAVVLAVTAALAAGSAASAQTWTKFHTMENGAALSYTADYTYTDKESGRRVLMQALSKGTLGPSAPGKADSVGSVVALDCKNKNLVTLGSYRPNAPLDIKADWRKETPKKAVGADNEALMKSACPHLDHAPVK